ncbi:MAG: hypothetical protein ACYCZF_06050 [Anaerolineae bacterium]
MLTMSRDTSPEAEKVLIELLRAAPSWKKLHRIASLNAAIRELHLCGMHQRYPDESTEQLKRRFADQVLGKEQAAQVYGPPTGGQDA